jgi:hypothetical protein
MCTVPQGRLSCENSSREPQYELHVTNSTKRKLLLWDECQVDPQVDMNPETQTPEFCPSALHCINGKKYCTCEDLGAQV